METYTLQLTARELQAIGSALGVRPYAEVAGVIASINAQVMKQQQAAHDAAADKRDMPSGAGAEIQP